MTSTNLSFIYLYIYIYMYINIISWHARSAGRASGMDCGVRLHMTLSPTAGILVCRIRARSRRICNFTFFIMMQRYKVSGLCNESWFWLSHVCFERAVSCQPAPCKAHISLIQPTIERFTECQLTVATKVMSDIECRLVHNVVVSATSCKSA